MRNRLAALFNARKIAGVTSGSRLNTQQNALAKGVYAAMIEGRHGQLYVRIGGSDNDWQPALSNYRDYREYAAGAGWKVWVSLPGNPAVQQAAPRAALPVPIFHKPEGIDVPDTWLN